MAVDETSHAVSVSFYHQTDSNETAMETVMTSPQPKAWPSATPAGEFWTAPEDGRFVARITTQAPTAAWTATVVHHPHAPVRSLMDANLSQGVDVIGHDSLTAPFDWSDVHELTLASVHVPATVSVDQLLSGSWVAGTPTNLLPGQTLKVYPYPDVSGGRIKVIESPVFMLQAQTHTFADLEGLEAPSYRPIDNATDNSSWPVINLTTPSTGELTLAVHDTTDTYRMVVDGWSESIHFVQFVLEGDVTGLELQLWDIDQNTGEVLATDITRPVGDQLKIGLQVGRGTHYLQVRFQDAAAATPHLWGEEADARTYTLRPSYSLIDEGKSRGSPPVMTPCSGAALHVGSWVCCSSFRWSTSSSTSNALRPLPPRWPRKSNDLRGTSNDWTAAKSVRKKPELTWPKRCMPSPNSNGVRGWRPGVQNASNTAPMTSPLRFGPSMSGWPVRTVDGRWWWVFMSSTGRGIWQPSGLTPPKVRRLRSLTPEVFVPRRGGVPRHDGPRAPNLPRGGVGWA